MRVRVRVCVCVVVAGDGVCVRACACVCWCWWCVCVCVCACVRLCASIMGDSVRLCVCVVVAAIAWWWWPLYALLFVCVYACADAQPAQKIHSPAPHTSGMHAPVAKQNTSQHKNTLTSTALTYLLLTPAPVSGSVCGGGGVCLWLAFLFRFVGALCIMCGVCVCECEWAFIYWVRASR